MCVRGRLLHIFCIYAYLPKLHTSRPYMIQGCLSKSQRTLSEPQHFRFTMDAISREYELAIYDTSYIIGSMADSISCTL